MNNHSFGCGFRRLPLAAATIAAILLAGCSNVPLETPTIVNRNIGSSGTEAAPITIGGVVDSGRTHVVTAGDTIYNISQRNGCTPDALMQLNGVSDPTTLRIGQSLRLPVATKAAVTAVAPGVRVERLDATGWTGTSAATSSAPIVAAVASSIRSGDEDSGASKVESAVRSASEAVDEARTSARSAVESASTKVSERAAEAKGKVASAVESVQAAVPGARFIWPVRGKVLSTFAQNGKGLDISGAVGSIVVAASAGEVLFVGNSVAGYGNLVIVKHTPTLVTAYGHNSKIVVKPGDRVKSGQKIAEMGKDDQGRAVLRFEVRDKGRPVDPMTHLTPQ